MKNKRRNFLKKTSLVSLGVLTESRTMIFYESPHKLVKTLLDFEISFGSDRKISVSRELTKLYEETSRGSLKEIIQLYTTKKPKGEYVIVVEGKGK